MWTQDDTLAYLKGTGKGNRHHSSGKGFGRRKSPRDRSGNLMRCRNCNSEEHLAVRCPKGKGKGKSIEFAAYAGPSGSDFTEAPAGRVFASPSPSPWDHSMGTFMNYGEDPFTYNDPWQPAGVPFTGPRRFVAPTQTAADLGAAWRNYRQAQAYGDDELSQASSQGANAQTQSAASASTRPRPPGASAGASASSGPDLRQFSQAAIASLMRDYEKGRGKGQPAPVGGDYPEDPVPAPFPPPLAHVVLLAYGNQSRAPTGRPLSPGEHQSHDELSAETTSVRTIHSGVPPPGLAFDLSWRASGAPNRPVGAAASSGGPHRPAPGHSPG